MQFVDRPCALALFFAPGLSPSLAQSAYHIETVENIVRIAEYFTTKPSPHDEEGQGCGQQIGAGSQRLFVQFEDRPCALALFFVPGLSPSLAQLAYHIETAENIIRIAEYFTTEPSPMMKRSRAAASSLTLEVSACSCNLWIAPVP